MSDDDFWVDSDGLASSAGGFDEKAKRLANLTDRLTRLVDPALVTSAVGDDWAAKHFLPEYHKGADQLFTGLEAYGKAIASTGDSVHAVAKNFSAAEDGATDGAKSLIRTTTGDASPTAEGSPATYSPLKHTVLGVPARGNADGAAEPPSTNPPLNPRIGTEITPRSPEVEPGGGSNVHGHTSSSPATYSPLKHTVLGVPARGNADGAAEPPSTNPPLNPRIGTEITPRSPEVKPVHRSD